MMLMQAAARPVRLWLGSGLPPDDPQEQDELKAVAGDTAMLRVLIVEDEFFISLGTDSLLRELGHTPVGVAVSAEEAVAMAERHRPDVVLMDIRLSGARDGIYAAEAILSRFGIPSIFVTANTDPQTRQRALAVGGLGFIEKPVSKERLVTGLKAAVR
jgi:two-component system, response regulator PdtaR